jgi:hypothetical protein
MTKYEKLRKISNELQEYADLEGSEIGEYWNTISNMSYHYDAMSNQFFDALIKEIELQFEDIKENYKIKTEQEEQVVVRGYKELVHKCEVSQEEWDKL